MKLTALIWLSTICAALAPARGLPNETLTPNLVKPNVLVLCVDDLRPELACFGVSYIQSPNIDRLASAGRAFRNHYVQAPTCGASRFTLLTGLYGGASNSALFQRAAKMKADPDSAPPSMPAVNPKKSAARSLFRCSDFGR